MAFNPSNYKAPEAKKLPVILLLDVSGSMSYDQKIEKLHDAVTQMVDSFVEAKVKETIIEVAIITFGREVRLHTPYSSVDDVKSRGVEQFDADGMTPMGLALKMAKDMIEDRNVTPSRIYRPAVVLVSDGAPTDDWRNPLTDFISDGRSQKCQRFAIAIGSDADRDMLMMFSGTDENLFVADKASEIADCFEKFTMSVSTRASSVNPNVFPALKSDGMTETGSASSGEMDRLPGKTSGADDMDDDPFL